MASMASVRAANHRVQSARMCLEPIEKDAFRICSRFRTTNYQAPQTLPSSQDPTAPNHRLFYSSLCSICTFQRRRPVSSPLRRVCFEGLTVPQMRTLPAPRSLCCKTAALHEAATKCKSASLGIQCPLCATELRDAPMYAVQASCVEVLLLCIFVCLAQGTVCRQRLEPATPGLKTSSVLKV